MRIAGWRGLVVCVPPVFLIALNGWRRLAADDRLRFGRGFLVWNFFGIADFLLVVFLGTLYMWPGFAAPTSTSLMQQPPFVAIAHITLLAQRRGAKEAKAA